MASRARVIAVADFDHDFRIGGREGLAELVVKILEGSFKRGDLVTIEGIPEEMEIDSIPSFIPFDPERSPSLVVKKPGPDRLPIEPGAIVEGVEKE